MGSKLSLLGGFEDSVSQIVIVKPSILSLSLQGLCGDIHLTETKLRTVCESVDANAFQEVDKDKNTPLHTLCLNEAVTPAMIRMLSEYDPSTVRALTLSDVSIFHNLTMNKGITSELLLVAYELFPEGIKQKHKWGYTPMNTLVWSIGEHGWTDNLSAYLAAIRTLHDLYPEAMSERDIESRTPVITACRKNCPLEVIELLHELNPAAARDTGMTALHRIFCASDFRIEAFHAVASQSGPEAMDKKNQDGETPLDCLSPMSKEDPLVNASICARFPEKAFLKIKGQHRPLMYFACKTGEAAEVALGAFVKAHTEVDKFRSSHVDINILPQLCSFDDNEVLGHVASSKCIREFVDDICTRPGPLTLLLFDLECNILLCALYPAFADALRRGTPLDDMAVYLVPLSCLTAYYCVRQVLYLYVQAKLGLLLSRVFNIWQWINVLIMSWLPLTLALGLTSVRSTSHFNTVCSAGMLICTSKLLSQMKLLNIDFAALVNSLVMILKDMRAFLILMAVIIIGFGVASYFLIIEEPSGMDSEDSGSRWDMFLVLYLIIYGSFDQRMLDSPAPLVMFVIFTFFGIIIMLNMLIAIVCESHAAAQASARRLFLTSRLEHAGEIVSVMPRFMFRDGGTKYVRGDFIALLLERVTTYKGKTPLQIGGIRHFVGSEYGYGKAGLLFVVCSLTVFLPFTLAWVCLYWMVRIVREPSVKALKPERLFSALDQEQAESEEGLASKVDRLAAQQAELMAKVDQISSVLLSLARDGRPESV